MCPMSLQAVGRLPGSGQTGGNSRARPWDTLALLPTDPELTENPLTQGLVPHMYLHQEAAAPTDRGQPFLHCEASG